MTSDERGGGRNQFALWDCILLVEFRQSLEQRCERLGRHSGFMDLTADLMQKMDSPEMEQFYKFVHGDTWKIRAAF